MSEFIIGFCMRSVNDYNNVVENKLFFSIKLKIY